MVFSFVEIMRAHVLDHDGERLVRELGSGAADVAQIVSEIRDRMAVEPPPPGNLESRGAVMQYGL